MYLGVFLIVLAILFAFVGIFSPPTLTKQPEQPPSGRVPPDSGPPQGEAPATPDEYIEARQKSQ